MVKNASLRAGEMLLRHTWLAPAVSLAAFAGLVALDLLA